MILGNRISRHDLLEQIAGIGNWELDFAAGTAVWSEEACRIYGVDPTENILKYEVWESFVHPEDLDKVKAAYELSKNTLTPYDVQHRIILRDGRMRHIFSHVEYVFNDEQRPVGLYGVAHDISDIMDLKNELLKSESNVRMMMDLIPVSVYARDVDGYYIFGNHVFLKHYGITYEQLKGKHLRDYVRSEEEYKTLKAQDDLVLNSDEKLFVSEFRQTDYKGDVKVWRIIKVPFTPEGQERRAILGIAEDITERKLYEENLQQLANSLAARNKSLEQYSQMVSHELRGPLATLMGMSDMVKNIKLSQEEVMMFFDGIEASLAKLETIVRKMNSILHENDIRTGR